MFRQAQHDSRAQVTLSNGHIELVEMLSKGCVGIKGFLNHFKTVSYD
jgi:hypothetical protein